MDEQAKWFFELETMSGKDTLKIIEMTPKMVQPGKPCIRQQQLTLTELTSNLKIVLL